MNEEQKEIQPHLCGQTLVISQLSALQVLKFAATACCSLTPPHLAVSGHEWIAPDEK